MHGMTERGPHNEMVERVARHLCDDDNDMVYAADDFPPAASGYPEAPVWTLYVDEARALIGLMREPTPAMVSAGESTTCDHGESNCGARNAWEAMIDAALADSAPSGV